MPNLRGSGGNDAAGAVSSADAGGIVGEADFDVAASTMSSVSPFFACAQATFHSALVSGAGVSRGFSMTYPYSSGSLSVRGVM